jgi:hypothetical protein
LLDITISSIASSKIKTVSVSSNKSFLCVPNFVIGTGVIVALSLVRLKIFFFQFFTTDDAKLLNGPVVELVHLDSNALVCSQSFDYSMLFFMKNYWFTSIRSGSINMC